MIWKEAMHAEPRVVMLYESFRVMPKNSNITQVSPVLTPCIPVLLHICQESREDALKVYTQLQKSKTYLAHAEAKSMPILLCTSISNTTSSLALAYFSTRKIQRIPRATPTTFESISPPQEDTSSHLIFVRISVTWQSVLRSASGIS